MTREESLLAIPIHNQSITITRDDAGMVSIAVPRKKAWWVDAIAKVFFVPDEKKIALDEIGSYVWGLCDGNNDVRTIIDQFAQKYKLNRKEAELSLLTYLKQLVRKGLIGMVVKTRQSKKNKHTGRKK